MSTIIFIFFNLILCGIIKYQISLNKMANKQDTNKLKYSLIFCKVMFCLSLLSFFLSNILNHARVFEIILNYFAVLNLILPAVIFLITKDFYNKTFLTILKINFVIIIITALCYLAIPFVIPAFKMPITIMEITFIVASIIYMFELIISVIIICQFSSLKSHATLFKELNGKVKKKKIKNIDGERWFTPIIFSISSVKNSFSTKESRWLWNIKLAKINKEYDTKKVKK